MSQPPPLPLDYRSAGEPRPRDPDAPKRFAAGLFGGMAVSALVYFGGWKLFPGGTVQVGIAIAAIKFGIGLACVLMPGRRALGAGILASLPVGFMIFFGSCMMLNPKL